MADRQARLSSNTEEVGKDHVLSGSKVLSGCGQVHGRNPHMGGDALERFSEAAGGYDVLREHT